MSPLAVNPASLWKCKLTDFFGYPLPAPIHLLLITNLQLHISSSSTTSACLRFAQQGTYVPATKPDVLKPQSDRRRNNVVISESVRASCSPEIKCLDLNFNTNQTLLKEITEFTENMRVGLAELERLRWTDMPLGLKLWKGEKEVRGALRKAMIAATEDLTTLWAVKFGKIPMMDVREKTIRRRILEGTPKGSEEEDPRNPIVGDRHNDRGKGKQKAETDRISNGRHQDFMRFPNLPHHDRVFENKVQDEMVDTLRRPKDRSDRTTYEEEALWLATLFNHRDRSND